MCCRNFELWTTTRQSKEVNLAFQVGRGGSGQYCDRNFISTSTRWSAGHPARHQPAEGQDPNLEEGKEVGCPDLIPNNPPPPHTHMHMHMHLHMHTDNIDWTSLCGLTGGVQHTGLQLEGECRVLVGGAQSKTLRVNILQPFVTCNKKKNLLTPLYLLHLWFCQAFQRVNKVELQVTWHFNMISVFSFFLNVIKYYSCTKPVQ